MMLKVPTLRVACVIFFVVSLQAAPDAASLSTPPETSAAKSAAPGKNSAEKKEESNAAPELFDTDGSGNLNHDELKRYFVKRDKLEPKVGEHLDYNYNFVPYTEPKTKTRINTLQEAIEFSLDQQAEKKLGEFLANNGEKDFYSFYEVKKFDGLYTTADGTLQRVDPDKKYTIAGWWGEPREVPDDPDKKTEIQLGPILIRKNRDERTKDDLDSVSGATVTYVEDRLEKKKTRSSEGAIIYPIVTRDGKEIGPWTFSPSLGWKFARISQAPKEGETPKPLSGDPAKGESDEVRLDFGVAYETRHTDGSILRRSLVEFDPYVISDSRFRGLIAGAKLDYTPVFQSGKFFLNTGYRGLIPSGRLRYRMALVPFVDFNKLYYESHYIDRDDVDSHLGIGARSEIGVKTSGFPSLETLITYQFLQGIGDYKEYSDLFTASVKFWVIPNIGITFQRQKGEAPVTEKDVDMTTLGLEVKF